MVKFKVGSSKMRKIITILFCMLFVTSAYSLDFDSNTDSCLRDILDKHEGIITADDLQNIEEFYCYSNEVTIESLITLAKGKSVSKSQFSVVLTVT